MLPDKYYINDLETYFNKTNFLPKNSDTCIIILNYNNKKFILELANYLNDIDCDVLIVDNYSTDGSYEELYKLYKDKFNLIQTNNNLGGAGGFGVGIQWVIEQNYEYCFVSEEDAMPLKGNEDIFYEMLKHKDKKCFTVAKFYDLGINSFNLHYTIYPVYILKDVGTLNKNLFFRADDQEWGMRIRTYLQKNSINIENKVVDRFYTHPLIKLGFGLFANYFSIRNAFIVYLKYSNRNFFIDYMINFNKYFSYSLFTFLNDKNIAPLKQFFYAFSDFIFDKYPNKKRINMFKNDKIEPENYHIEESDFDNFFQQFKSYKIITNSMKNKHFEIYNFSNFFKNGVVASKYNGVARIKSFWFKNIVFVEGVDFINKQITFFKYENKKLFKSRITILSSVLASSLFSIIFLPIIFYKKSRYYL